MTIVRSLLKTACFLLITACSTVPNSAPTKMASGAAITLPNMNLFPQPQLTPVGRSNTSVASDFMRLAFELETGRKLPVLSRFEGPISVSVRGNAPPSLPRDLGLLLARLRGEAGIDIRQTTADANITIQVLPRRTLHANVPNAACFVAPRVSSWREFKATRRSSKGDWTTLTQRETMSIFLPGDVSPQEIRDCLHEELAQALGPVNDLFHLRDSVFNDDNFHTILTSFDMLILRTFYDGELTSGMTPNAVAARLPQILSRLNPSGGYGQPEHIKATPAPWKTAINQTLGVTTRGVNRVATAKRAVALARGFGPQDNRLGFSLYALGRQTLGSDSTLALSSFHNAAEIFRAHPATQLHAAHVAVQLAAHALTSGAPQSAIDLVNSNFNAALSAQNAGLLASLLLIKAQALDDLGKTQKAAIIRLDSLGWARYGFGSDAEITQHVNEIAALSAVSPRTLRR